MGIALATAATTEIEMAQLLTIVALLLFQFFTPFSNLVQFHFVFSVP